MNGSDVERSLARSLAWLLAITFFAATVIILLLNFDITAPGPTFREQGEQVLVDNILIDFENQQQRWPQDLAANVLFAIGFAAVAGLGGTLPRLLGSDDGRSRALAVAFVVAGTLGLVGQLAYIGAKEVGIDSQYCECALRAEQLISRAEGLHLVINAQGWLTDGFAVLFGAGLLAAAGAGSLRSPGWRTYTLWMGVAAIAFVVVGHLLTFISSDDMDLSTVSIALIAIVAGVLTPIWAVWTARTLGTETD